MKPIEALAAPDFCVGGKIEMSYKSKVDEKNKLVHITLSGTMAVDVALQYTMDARALADKHDYTRLLFDIRKFESRPSIMQIYNIAAKSEERGLTYEYKRATVFWRRTKRRSPVL